MTSKRAGLMLALTASVISGFAAAMILAVLRDRAAPAEAR